MRQSMRLHSKKNDIHGSGFLKICDHLGTHFEIAIRTDHPDAAFLHCLQMRTASEQSHILPGPRHLCSDVAADGSRAGDQKLHPLFPARAVATAPRWIFPVAVRGIVSTMYHFLGHLKSASRSRQCARIADSLCGSRSPTAAPTSPPPVAWGTPHRAEETT